MLLVPVLHGRWGAWDEIVLVCILAAMLLGFSVLFLKAIRRGGAQRK
jgi:hypothetical protein